MKHYGDITKISGYDVPTVDIITGGSPCQDLSVAGKRAGLSGERSGLFMEQLRIVKEMREKEKESGKTADNIRPRYMVWENVPGAFSSNKGEDFQAVLTEIVRIVNPNCPDVPLPKKWAKSGCLMGYGENGQPFSVAYRLHDAQFWGVPQRRKRIALVADFNGITAPEILFERCGVQGDITQSREKKQGTSTDVERSVGNAISFQGVIGFNRGNGSGIPAVEEKQPTLQAAAGESGNNQPLVCQPILLESNQNHATIQTDGVSTTLPASMGMGGGYVPMITDKVVALTTEMTPKTDENQTSFSLRGRDYKDAQCVASAMQAIGEYKDCGVSSSLKQRDYKDGTDLVVQGIDLYNQTETGNVSKTLNSARSDSDHVPCVYALDRAMYNQGINAAYEPSIEKELSQTLVSRGPGALCAKDYKGVGNAIVRRLTPLECERLQGFPDNWTDIGDWTDSKGKKHKGESDAPRYKALGNSIALPFWEYLAEKMCKYIENPEMASLFDGIGGFPLVYSRCGCVPVWASEIEEFPIAVTKMRFGEE